MTELDLSKFFLIIGAMKSGTSSLFRDVSQHPDIFAPHVKEPGDLGDDAVLTDKGRKRYFDLFRSARPGSWAGEASVKYTNYPVVKGVPERARRILGPDVKIIFIGRDPVERLKSQYRYNFAGGGISVPLKEIDLSTTTLVSRSNYDMQLTRWLDVFPEENLLVLRYEDYIRFPELVVRRVWGHLNLDQIEGGFGINTNPSSGGKVPRGIIRKIITTDVYVNNIQRRVPQSLRRCIKFMLVKKGPTSFDDQISEDVEERLRTYFEDATRRFRSMAVRFPDEDGIQHAKAESSR